MIVVSLEPSPDYSPAPFALKPLLSIPQARTVAPDSHMLNQNLDS
ncbi:hypothetical protein [Lacinutrix sp.]|nr:hypothetical protein [Lacinutrix sp.]